MYAYVRVFAIYSNYYMKLQYYIYYNVSILKSYINCNYYFSLLIYTYLYIFHIVILYCISCILTKVFLIYANSY